MKFVRYCSNNPYWGGSGVMLTRPNVAYGILVAACIERDQYRGWDFTLQFRSLRLRLNIDTPRARRLRAG